MTSVDHELVSLFMWVVGGLLGILVALLAWIGNRIHSRLDDIGKTLGRIELDMRDEVAVLDKRIALLESDVEDHDHKLHQLMEPVR